MRSPQWPAHPARLCDNGGPAMKSPLAALTTTLFDAADAPELRARVSELETQLAARDLAIGRQARQIERLEADVKFYYAAFTGKQLTIAEDAWGLPGGG
jgi:hypothetical protein